MKTLFRLVILSTYLAAFGVLADKVVVSGWGGLDRLIMHKTLYDIAAPELTTANIDVDYTALESNHNSFLLNRFSSGKAPDVFYLDVSDVTTLANLNLFLDFAEDAPWLIDKIRPELTELFKVGGKTLGLVKDFNTISVQFNKDIFNKYQAPFLTDDETFDSFYTKLANLANKLKPVGRIALCLDPDFASFAPFVLSNGWKPFTPDNRTVLDDKFKQAFEFYVSLVRKGVAVVPNTIGHAWSSGCFAAGLSAVSIEGTWVNQHMNLNAPNLNFGSVMPPISDIYGRKSNVIFAVAWAINKNSENLSASIKLVDILTNRPVQNFIYSRAIAIPASKLVDADLVAGISDSEQELFNTVEKIIAQSELLPYQFKQYGSAWMEPINKALRTAMLTNQSIDSIILKAQNSYDNLYTNTYLQN